MEPEALYRQLGQLVAEAPHLRGREPLDANAQRWLGRVGALVEVSCENADVIAFRVAADNLQGVMKDANAQTVLSILHRALARAELKAPAAAQGAFIAVGAQFDAFQALAKVLAEAKKDALVVDPYIDDAFLGQFAAMLPEGVGIRLLGNEKHKDCGARLLAAQRAWTAQYGAQRPLEARRVTGKELHDRILVLDLSSAWTVGQSFKDLARSSPTALILVPPEVAPEKISYYNDVWSRSSVLS